MLDYCQNMITYTHSLYLHSYISREKLFFYFEKFSLTFNQKSSSNINILFHIYTEYYYYYQAIINIYAPFQLKKNYNAGVA